MHLSTKYPKIKGRFSKNIIKGNIVNSKRKIDINYIIS